MSIPRRRGRLAALVAAALLASAAFTSVGMTVTEAPAAAATPKEKLAAQYGLGRATSADKWLGTKTGTYQTFQNGAVVWSKKTGNAVMKKGMLDTWKKNSWEKGNLGYPTMNETKTPDGKGAYQHFQKGSIHWSPATGAHSTWGSQRSVWSQTGWEKGSLGYPTGEQQRLSTGLGTYQNFQKGTVVWNKSGTGRKAGARWMNQATTSAWKNTGWEKGTLQFPQSNPATKNGVTTQQFVFGEVQIRNGSPSYKLPNGQNMTAPKTGPTIENAKKAINKAQSMWRGSRAIELDLEDDGRGMWEITLVNSSGQSREYDVNLAGTYARLDDRDDERDDDDRQAYNGAGKYNMGKAIDASNTFFANRYNNGRLGLLDEVEWDDNKWEVSYEKRGDDDIDVHVSTSGRAS